MKGVGDAIRISRFRDSALDEWYMYEHDVKGENDVT